jgi:hypothetical protein
MTAGYLIPVDVQMMLMLRLQRERLRYRIITKRAYREIRTQIREQFARVQWWDDTPLRTTPVRRKHTKKQVRKMLQKARMI